MRTLSDTLTSYQKKLTIDALVKVVLTQGVNTYTYTRTRLIDVQHDEEPFSQKATLTLDNSDKALTDLDFKGYQAVISYGANTSAGEEYSACSPLKVIGQKLDSSSSHLYCILECIGVPNLLAEEKAESNYIPASTDTLTVKGIIADLFDGTITAFSSYPNYTVDWDSEDTLIDSYVPKDSFRIYRGGSRLAALRRLLDYTGCAVRFDADGHITIFVPTISGTTYDYQYALETQTETVRPSGAGDETNIDSQFPAADSHFDKVDEATADDATTYVYTANADWQRDLYALGNNASGQGIINYVKVYARGYAGGTPTQASLKIAIKTGGTAYEGDTETLTYNTWVNYSKTWAINPQSGAAWTWTDINNLQTGVSLRRCKTTGGAATQISACTQVYVEVGYENHTFFAKAYRKRLVIPNKVSVASQADDSPAYSGSATDTDSYNALAQYIVEPINMRLASDVQAASIATAVLGKYQMHAEAGSGEVPMNAGAEVFDYVRVYDTREGDSRTGNIGWIHRRVNLRKSEWKMSFGFGGWYTSRGLLSQLESDPSGIGQYFLKLGVKDLYAENIKAAQIDLTTIDQDDIGDGTTYGRVLNTHLSSNGIQISSITTYAAGYNPSTKRRNFTAEPTTPYDVGDMWHAAGTVKRCSTARASGAYVAGDWTAVNLDDMADGTTYQRIKATNISDGNIKLTSNVVVNGEWYNSSGVEIDADNGINIYGTANALTTRATKTGTIQCYVGADGAIYAGAGAVWLNSSGVTVKDGAWLMAYNGATKVGDFGYVSGVTALVLESLNSTTLYLSGATTTYLRAESGDISLISSTGNINIGTLVPHSGSTYSVGVTGTRFSAAYVNNYYGTTLDLTGDIVCNDIFPTTGSIIGSSGTKVAQIYVTTAYIGTIGDADNKVVVYCNGLTACPVPANESGLAIIKKLPKPKYTPGDFGIRKYYAVEDLPDEMTTLFNGKKDTEYLRIIGVLLQSVQELTDKVDILEAKIGAG